jgi:hypothetical protein
MLLRTVRHRDGAGVIRGAGLDIRGHHDLAVRNHRGLNGVDCKHAEQGVESHDGDHEPGDDFSLRAAHQRLTPRNRRAQAAAE